MGFQDFWRKVIGNRKQAEPTPLVGRVGFFEEQTGYYSIRDAEFAHAYSIWIKSKYFPKDQVLALAPELIVENLNNRSGYVREFCLRALILRDYSDALKDVVNRLNDYVPINRNLATQLVLTWLEKIPLEQIIGALPEFAAVSQQSRASHELVHGALHTRLDQDAGQHALESGLQHTRAKVRRECWKLCLQKFNWSSSKRVEAAMLSRDPSIARLVEPDVSKLDDIALVAWFNAIHKVRPMPLRRAILTATHQKNLVGLDALSERALWDDSFSIRWLARHWLKESPDQLTTRYLHALEGIESPRHKRYALEGLAILKNIQTLDACKKALTDKHQAVRKAAFISCCQINPENSSQYISEALQDSSLSIVCQALRQIATSGEPLPEEVLKMVAIKRTSELEFFVRMLAIARGMPLWAALQLASFSDLSAASLKLTLQNHVDDLLSRFALTSVYFGPNQQQWRAIYGWSSYKALSPASLLRQVAESFIKS